MKLLVIGINYKPELTGMAVYNTEMCEYLVEKGHEVSILTGFPYYPFGSKFPEWHKNHNVFRLFLNEKAAGVNLMRVNMYSPKKVSTVKRIFHEGSFIVLSFIRLLFSTKKYTIILCISPPLLSGIVAYIISKMRGIPFVFHIQDLQPDAAAELGMLNNKVILKFLYCVEKYIYKSAAKITVISSEMREKILKKGISSEKVIVFPNWADVNQMKRGDGSTFRKKYKLENKFIVLYSGNIGAKQGLDIILDAAEKSVNKDIIYLIVGDGACKAELIMKCSSKKLSNVMFLPLQPKCIFPDMLAAADVCLVPQKKNVSDIFFPSKLVGIMAAGRPVIAGLKEGSGLHRVMSESECGLIVEPENPDSLNRAINQMRLEPSQAAKYALNGSKYAQGNFEKKKILDLFNILLSDLIC